MPSKTPRTRPVCHHLGLINLNQHLNGVHSFTGQERKQLIQKGMVESEVMVTESQSHIEKHISFLDMLQHGERLRIELMKKATQGELKAILELCLNMNEGIYRYHKENRIVLSFPPLLIEIYHCQTRKSGC